MIHIKMGKYGKQNAVKSDVIGNQYCSKTSL